MGLSTKEVSGEWEQAPPVTEAAKLPKPLQEDQETEALKCPRCDSMNTKFCYYNNYNKSQPRYFCKACKRHWTKGGTLRNVPVGGVRKNKRAKISNTTTNTASDTTYVGPTNNFQCTDQDTNFSDQKSMSSFLQALLQKTPASRVKVEKEEKEFTWFSNALSSSNVSNGENPIVGGQQDVIPKLEFPFSSVSGSFELNSSLMNSSSYQSLDVYGNILDSVEESTITSVNVPTTSAEPWAGSGPSTIDFTNYWNWNEIDTLPENLWDEDGEDSSEIKP